MRQASDFGRSPMQAMQMMQEMVGGAICIAR